MVWNAYKGLGRAMNVPYSLNMTCYGVNPKLPFEQNCVAEGPFLFDISASTPPSLRFIVMLRRHKRPFADRVCVWVQARTRQSRTTFGTSSQQSSSACTSR